MKNKNENKNKVEQSKSYLDTMRDESENLRDVQFGLASMSKAYFRTGNNQIGIELIEYADAIELSIEKINDAVGKRMNDDLIKSQEMTGTIMKSVFAGMELERRAIKAGAES